MAQVFPRKGERLCAPEQQGERGGQSTELCAHPQHPGGCKEPSLPCSPLSQGLPSPMLRCPSQRLLDRIVRRYAEVPDAGSIYMDHLTDRDKLRLLYTLAVNSHPILLQVCATLPQLETPPQSCSQASPGVRCVPGSGAECPRPALAAPWPWKNLFLLWGWVVRARQTHEVLPASVCEAGEKQ